MSVKGTKKTFNWFKWFIVVAFIIFAGAGLYHYAVIASTVEAVGSSVASSTSSSLSDEDKDEIDAIRNRADIKKQQELLVQETYLDEKKADIQKKKTDALTQYDAQISDVETKLEGVRADKMSFQSPLKQ